MKPFIKSELIAFEDYLIERQEIAERKRAGKSRPWTDNEILRNHHFCEVFRDDDRTSQDARKFIQSLPTSEQLALCMWFRLVNKAETLRAVAKSKAREAHDIESVLVRLPSCFNSQAYRIMVTGGLWSKPQIARMIARAYRAADEGWRPARTARQTCDDLSRVVGSGPFIAYQSMQDLRWWKNTRYADEDEWCFIGPGAGRGLRRLLGEPLDLAKTKSGRMANAPWGPSQQRAYLPYIAALVRHCQRAGAELNAFEIEHNLCETDKLRRIESGESGGRKYKPKETGSLFEE